MQAWVAQAPMQARMCLMDLASRCMHALTAACLSPTVHLTSYHALHDIKQMQVGLAGGVCGWVDRGP